MARHPGQHATPVTGAHRSHGHCPNPPASDAASLCLMAHDGVRPNEAREWPAWRNMTLGDHAIDRIACFAVVEHGEKGFGRIDVRVDNTGLSCDLPWLHFTQTDMAEKLKSQVAHSSA